MHWDQSSTEAVVRQTVLELAPDVVLYQELPGLVPFVETHDMVRANPRSHSGHLASLVSQDLFRTEPGVRIVEGCAVLTTFASPEITIANVHLTPGKGAAADRLMQMSTVIEASPTNALLIIGDTNMRMAEAAALVDLGFSGDKPPAPTWDSRRNRFRTGGAEFSAYFTRWFASPGVTVSDVVVHRDPVEHDGRRFFVSDHFALSATVAVR